MLYKLETDMKKIIFVIVLILSLCFSVHARTVVNRIAKHGEPVFNEELPLSGTEYNSLEDCDNEKEDADKDSLSDFAPYSISYLASFKYAEIGYYMFGGHFLNAEGWGFDFQIGSNIGLVERDYSGVVFMVGPGYGCTKNNIQTAVFLDFVGITSSNGSAEYRKANNIDKENRFDWGLSLEPRITVKLGRIFPWAGLSVQWAEATDKITVGFHVGIGINI